MKLVDRYQESTAARIHQLRVEMPTRMPHSTITRTEGTQCSLCLRYLSNDEYSLWDDLVKESPQGSVFCGSWFLKAVAPDVRILACFKGERLIAGIPLHFERRLGLNFCRMPPLVHTWGVVMAPFEGKHVTVFSLQMKVLTLFAEELAKQRFFIQSFHPTQLNWLPFYWNGFRQVTHYSHVIEDITDVARIWDEMEGNTRRNIRKAEKCGITVVPCNSELVTTMLKKTFTNQHKSLFFSPAHFERLCKAAMQHDSGACLAAVDLRGRPHAAGFVLWDQKRAYYLAAGTDPELRVSGAASLLMWHMVKFTSGRAIAFDFAGSVIQQIERFFVGFGGKLVPYNRIMKLPRSMCAALSLMGMY
jgi:Acetyltransferase (GNAT) domain